MSAYGRLHLGPSFNDDYTQIWGYVTLTTEAMTEIEQLTTRLHTEEMLRYQSEVVPFFRRLEPQEVIAVIDAIKEKSILWHRCSSTTIVIRIRRFIITTIY